MQGSAHQPDEFITFSLQSQLWKNNHGASRQLTQVLFKETGMPSPSWGMAGFASIPQSEDEISKQTNEAKPESGWNEQVPSWKGLTVDEMT